MTGIDENINMDVISTIDPKENVGDNTNDEFKKRRTHKTKYVI